jgi:hypothetical protein
MPNSLEFVGFVAAIIGAMVLCIPDKIESCVGFIWKTICCKK